MLVLLVLVWVVVAVVVHAFNPCTQDAEAGGSLIPAGHLCCLLQKMLFSW